MDLAGFFGELAGWTRDSGIEARPISYGDHPEQEADLRLPKGPGPHPVAIVVHGGFWRAAFTRSNTAAIAADLARRGFATWNIEYRRLAAGGGIPATLDDVRAATAHLAMLDVPLDLDRVVAVGHSAGAQLALWLAGERHISAAISLAGISDIVEAARVGLGDGAVTEFAGDPPDARVDPAQHLPTGVRQLLVHGTADDRVPIEQSRTFAARAAQAGDDCELLELPGVDHFAVIDPRSDAWTSIAEKIEALVTVSSC